MAPETEVTKVGSAYKKCLLFTDIEGSTDILQSHAELYPSMLARHYALIKNAIQEQGGKVLDLVGDSTFAIFDDTNSGLNAALNAQENLSRESWAHGEDLRVRMGIHSGPVEWLGDMVVGIEVHRTARITAVGKGGQIVLSREARKDLKQGGSSEIKINDLGFFRLKDLHYPEALFEVEAPGLTIASHETEGLTSQATNLPRELPLLVGREREMSDVRDLLLKKNEKLVTFTGVGGSGKTSLALAVGKSVLPEFANGVFFIQLSQIETSDLVPSVVAQTLGIVDQAGIPTTDTIARVIGDNKTLLIFDTFEHVIDGVDFLTNLQKKCEKLSVIATSREPLAISNERIFEVLPLEVPSPGADYSTILTSSSVQLFLELVEQETKGFRISEENAFDISEICRLLDGLPLALGLAAARIGFFEPSEIADGLKKSRINLKNRLRISEDRHQTLRATVEWSDNLLNASARKTFYSLSVFSGGFDISSARFVIGGTSDQDTMSDVEDLVHKNLVVKRRSLGVNRYFLLDTIKEYGQTALSERDQFQSVANLHADYFLNLVIVSESKILGFDQKNHVETLFEELSNIRVALDHLLSSNDFQKSTSLIRALMWFWISRGLFSEGIRWTELALGRMGENASFNEVAEVQTVVSWLRFMSGDPEGALEPALEAFKYFESTMDLDGISRAGIMAGMATAVSGDEGKGVQIIETALKAAEESGNDRGASIALIAIGEGLRGEGNDSGAEELYIQALQMLEKDGDTFWPGMLAFVTSLMRLKDGQVAEAAKLAHKALMTGEHFNYPVMVILSIASCAGLALKQGHVIIAAKLIGAVLNRMERTGAGFEPPDLVVFEEISLAVKNELGLPDFEEAVDLGAQLPWKEVVDLGRKIMERTAFDQPN